MRKRLRKLKKSFALLISGNRQNVLLKSLHVLSSKYIKIYENNNVDISTNGEARILKILGTLNARMIFDVGANIGVWSRTASAYNSKAEIHAFEPVPPVFNQLEAHVNGYNAIKINMFGLGDSEGVMQFTYSESRSDLSTMMDIPIPTSGNQENLECHVTTGDAYCQEHDIQLIDLLKIDVEGAEPMVLSGFKKMLEERRIKAIQFEYTPFCIYTKNLLYDYYSLLEGYGFTIGKIYPNEVAFRKYHISMEDFVGLNYLAIHESAKEWISEFG